MKPFDTKPMILSPTRWLVLFCFIPWGIQRSEAQVDAIAPERYEIEVDGHVLQFPYYATHDLSAEASHPDITHLFVMIHGTLRNADVYHPLAVDAVRRAEAVESTAVLTPQFLMAQDLEAHEVDGDVLYWTNAGWKQGDRSLATDNFPRPARISSYGVLEQMVSDIVDRFPGLERITLAGHSAGGQYINRFAAGNRSTESWESSGVTVRFIISNPSSYVYFTRDRRVDHHPDRDNDDARADDGNGSASVATSRPVTDRGNDGPAGRTDDPPEADTERSEPRFSEYDPADHGDRCPNFNRYRFGLEGLNEYMESTGAERIRQQYGQRHVVYLLSANDNDPGAAYLDRSCGALLQGPARFQRGVTYYLYQGHLFGDEVYDHHFIMVVPNVAHNARRVFNSTVGLRAVFDEQLQSTDY